MDRAPGRVMRVRPLGGIPLLGRTSFQHVVHPDPLDNQHTIFHFDLAFGRRDQIAPARIDSARLQRATQSSGESTGSGRDHVVKSGRVRVVPGRRLVVLRDLVVHPEKNGRRLGGQKRLPQRALDPLNADP